MTTSVGIVLHNHRPEARELATSLVAMLAASGRPAWLPAEDAELIARPDLGCDLASIAEQLALAVSIGGDGTMLRTVDLVSAARVPVMGIDVGQLGYLTEVAPEDLRHAIERFFAGEHVIEDRMMVAVSLHRANGSTVEMHHGLNEAVLEKTPTGHTVRLGVSIDDEFFTSYAADGLIVATPTGSTAYSFSARGPIVAPLHRALVLTPVAAHMLFDRAMVLEPSTVVRIEVLGYRPAGLAVDGRTVGELNEGDAIECTASDRPARIVTFGPRNFHGILKNKFGLSDR